MTEDRGPRQSEGEPEDEGTDVSDRAGGGAAPVIIVPCKDGPLLVRGEADLRFPNGEPVPRRRRTVALCRCGASGIKPFCDGSHKAVGFTTDDERPGAVG